MRVLLLGLFIFSILHAQESMNIEDVNINAQFLYRKYDKNWEPLRKEKYNLKDQNEVNELISDMNFNSITRDFRIGLKYFNQEAENEKYDLIYKSILVNELTEMDINVTFGFAQNGKLNCPIEVKGRSNKYEIKYKELRSLINELAIIYNDKSQALVEIQDASKYQGKISQIFKQNKVFSTRERGTTNKYYHAPYQLGPGEAVPQNERMYNCTDIHKDVYFGKYKTTLLEYTLYNFDKKIQSEISFLNHYIEVTKKLIINKKDFLNIDAISSNEVENINDNDRFSSETKLFDINSKKSIKNIKGSSSWMN